jgi:CMP-N,N'-diacetyllegionaminic acid synthase
MMPVNSCFAIILHRAGSQRLPHKATQLLNGRAMASYTFEAVTHSKLLEHIWLFTDDWALQQLAKTYPAIKLTPFDRPAHLSGPQCESADTLQYCLQQLQASGINLPPWCMLLQVTSPQRTADHIDAALTLLAQHPQADCLLSVSPPSKPPQWLMAAMAPTTHDHPLWLSDQPALPAEAPYWMPNGALFIGKTNAILNGQPMISGQILAYHMGQCIDVDTAEDLLQVSQRLASGS